MHQHLSKSMNLFAINLLLFSHERHSMGFGPRVLLGIGALLLLAASTTAAPPKDPCAIPKTLQSELANSYPGKTIVHLSDLSEYDKKHFRKDHGDRCPGLVGVDFYGDKNPTFALVLISGQNPQIDAKLVVAHQIGSRWDLRLVESTDGAPVVWRDRPGKYDDIYGEKSLRATHQVVVLCWYESSAIVYSWTGKEIEKVWLSD